MHWNQSGPSPSCVRVLITTPILFPKWTRSLFGVPLYSHTVCGWRLPECAIISPLTHIKHNSYAVHASQSVPPVHVNIIVWEIPGYVLFWDDKLCPFPSFLSVVVIAYLILNSDNNLITLFFCKFVCPFICSYATMRWYPLQFDVCLTNTLLSSLLNFGSILLVNNSSKQNSSVKVNAWWQPVKAYTPTRIRLICGLFSLQGPK